MFGCTLIDETRKVHLRNTLLCLMGKMKTSFGQLKDRIFQVKHIIRSNNVLALAHMVLILDKGQEKSYKFKGHFDTSKVPIQCNFIELL